MAWLTTNGLIRNFTLVVTNIAGGQTATKFLTMLRPKGSFAVVTNNGKTYIDPASYHRYDAYADAFNAIDATGGARLYATLKPRIADAYRDAGLSRSGLRRDAEEGDRRAARDAGHRRADPRHAHEGALRL